VITHRIARATVRIFAALSAVTLGVVAPLLTQAALADTPAAWDDAPHVSAIHYLLILLIIPGGIALLITLLVMLPSLIRGDSYTPGETWVGQDEWFGGPRKGVEAAGEAEKPAGERGGAGAEF
jgi:hypothetical protein